MNKLKLTKKALAAVISVAVAAAVITALLIVNIFYPLKYLSAYFVRRTRPQQGQLVLRMLDVGQADCALATLPDGKVMLIDGGDGSYTSTLSVIRALNSIDCDFIDYVVCTSVKAEHCGGLAEIIGMFGAGTIFYPYCVNKHITRLFLILFPPRRAAGRSSSYRNTAPVRRAVIFTLRSLPRMCIPLRAGHMTNSILPPPISR